MCQGWDVSFLVTNQHLEKLIKAKVSESREREGQKYWDRQRQRERRTQREREEERETDRHITEKDRQTQTQDTGTDRQRAASHGSCVLHAAAPLTLTTGGGARVHALPYSVDRPWLVAGPVDRFHHQVYGRHRQGPSYPDPGRLSCPRRRCLLLLLLLLLLL